MTSNAIAEEFSTTIIMGASITRIREEGRFGKVQRFKHRQLTEAVADIERGERVLVTSNHRPQTVAKYLDALAGHGFLVVETIWDVTEPVGSNGDSERRIRLVMVR